LKALAALIQQTGTDYDEHAVGTGACNATSARKREAITRCLQLAMWDSAAAVLDELVFDLFGCVYSSPMVCSSA